MILTGHDAIEWAENNGQTVNKYNDPIEAARDCLSADEAREIAAEDPSLIWVETDTAEAKGERMKEQIYPNARYVYELVGSCIWLTIYRNGELASRQPMFYDSEQQAEKAFEVI